MSEDFDFSHEWFESLLMRAIRDAVEQHGDPARMVGWTIREQFVRDLPRGSFTYHGEQAFPLESTSEGKA